MDFSTTKHGLRIWAPLLLAAALVTHPLASVSAPDHNNASRLAQTYAVRQTLEGIDKLGPVFLKYIQLLDDDDIKVTDPIFKERFQKEFDYEQRYLRILVSQEQDIDADASQVETALTYPGVNRTLTQLANGIHDHCDPLLVLKSNVAKESAMRAPYQDDLTEYIHQVEVVFPADTHELENARSVFSPETADSLLPRLLDACSQLEQVVGVASP